MSPFIDLTLQSQMCEADSAVSLYLVFPVFVFVFQSWDLIYSYVIFL